MVEAPGQPSSKQARNGHPVRVGPGEGGERQTVQQETDRQQALPAHAVGQQPDRKTAQTERHSLRAHQERRPGDAGQVEPFLKSQVQRRQQREVRVAEGVEGSGQPESREAMGTGGPGNNIVAPCRGVVWHTGEEVVKVDGR